MEKKDSEMQRRLAAAHPEASANLFRELAADKSASVRKAVALNFNTPLEVLWGLVEEYPELCVENEAFRLAIVVDLGALHRAPEKALEVLLKQKQVPEPWLRWGSRHEGYRVRVAVAEHSSTPVEVLELLATDDSWKVRKAVAEHPSAPAEALEQLAGDDFLAVRKAVAVNPSSPREVLEQLAADHDWVSKYVRWAVAANSQAPVEVLGELVVKENSDIRQVARRTLLLAIRREEVPADALQELAGSESSWVRKTVARRELAPLEVLKQLAGDEEEDVRKAVAENSSTPPALLRQLAEDSNAEVQQAARSHPNAPQGI